MIDADIPDNIQPRAIVTLVVSGVWKGLRIDVTDKNAPILFGAVGVRAHGTDAWFDNIYGIERRGLIAISLGQKRLMM